MSESERRDIYNSLEAAIGLETANNLMKLLPYQPAEQLVTRADMHAQTTMLRGEMSELRAELRGEMAGLRTDLTSDISDLRVELKGDFLHLENRFEQRFTDLQVQTQRLITAALAANVIAVVTALIA